MTATEVFESVTNGGSSDFALLIHILNQHGNWCVVRGLAVNCYVEPVFTIDADVVVASSELPSVRRDLVANGFVVEEHEHSVNAQQKGSELRIKFTTDARYEAFLGDAQTMEVLGEQVAVASLTNII